MAKQLAETKAGVPTGTDPSAPSGPTPPHTKPPAKGRSKAKGAKPGHPGQRRPAPIRIDRREEHSLSACPKCHGPVRPCRGSRTRVIEDIPADITPVVTEHTIHRSWCPHCRTAPPTCTGKGPIQGKLFTYIRYNVDLTQEGLDELGLSNFDASQVQAIDSVAHKNELDVIGRTAGSKAVDWQHFSKFA